jgi:hypothetical protein
LGGNANPAGLTAYPACCHCHAHRHTSCSILNVLFWIGASEITEEIVVKKSKCGVQGARHREVKDTQGKR